MRDPPRVGVVLLESALPVIFSCFELWVKFSSTLSSARLTWSFRSCKAQQSLNGCLKQNELFRRCRFALEMRGDLRGISHPVSTGWCGRTLPSRGEAVATHPVSPPLR